MSDGSTTRTRLPVADTLLHSTRMGAAGAALSLPPDPLGPRYGEDTGIGIMRIADCGPKRYFQRRPATAPGCGVPRNPGRQRGQGGHVHISFLLCHNLVSHRVARCHDQES